MKIVQIGHPILRRKAALITKNALKNRKHNRLFQKLETTLKKIRTIRSWPKVNGVAAPQIGISKRAIVVFDGAKYIKLANPRITFKSRESIEAYDGCFSFLYLRGKVSRHKEVVVEALNHEGNEIKIRAKGAFSCVLQHEIDHLNGILYIDRMKDLTTLTSIENYYCDPKKLRQTRKVIELITRSH